MNLNSKECHLFLNCLLKKVCCFAFFLIFFAGTPSIAGYQIRSNNDPIIKKWLSPYKESSVSLAKVDAIIQDITQSGLYQMVYAEKISSNTIIIYGQKSDRLENINIIGNTFVKTEDISKEVSLKKGQQITSLDIQQAIQKIKKLYEKSGFFNSNITYRFQPNDKNSLLTFNIDERKPCLIKDIKLFSSNDNLNRALTKELESLKTTPFNQFTKLDIEKQISQFFNQERYLQASISNLSILFNRDKTKANIKITIDNPIHFEFIFSGNSHFSAQDLTRQLEIGTQFIYRVGYDAEMQEKIRNYYLEKGFPKISIHTKEEVLSTLNKRILLFQINEQSRAKLGTIKIDGKYSQPQTLYTQFIEDELKKNSKSIFFVEEALHQASDNMIVFLKNRGYMKAEKVSLTYKIDSKNFTHVDIQIDEGPLTYIRKVLFRGAKSFSKIDLLEKVNLTTNSPLDLKVVQNSFSSLEEFYKSHGYLEFKINNRNAEVINYTEGNTYADIAYSLSEGPQIKVGEIIVKGNSKTREYVILREIDFTTGDILTSDRLNDSIEQLEKTGLFSQVRINSLEPNSKKSVRRILVEVSERNPGLFSAGLGINNDLDLTGRGFTSVVYNNLYGKARAISSRIDLKYSTLAPIYYLENRFSLGYYEPYVFFNRTRGRISLVREEEVFAIEQTDATATASSETVVKILSRNEINFSAEKEFSRNLRLTYRMWSFSNQTTFERANRGNSKTINIGATGPIVELDYRNDQFLPTRGTYTRFEMEYSDPLLGSSRSDPSISTYSTGASKEVNYIKASLGSNFYVPIKFARQWVWASSLRGGFLQNISSRSVSGVPAVKSFFLGGGSTIRGFQNRTERVPSIKELCAKQGISPCELDEFYVRRNSSYFLLKTELRFPLFGIFGGVVFYDGGAVFLKEFDLEDPYRDAVGAGIRVETPVGAFVLEVGFKLDRKSLNVNYDNESPFAINFSLGNF